MNGALLLLVRPARDPAPNAKPAGYPVLSEMLRPIPAACNAECDIPSAPAISRLISV
jgi:hypothetical protein